MTLSPLDPERFFSSPFGYLAQFLLEMYTYSYVQLSPQGEKKTLWAAAPCSNLSSSSSWLPHPTCCHPLLDTLSISWVPQQTPSPNHGPTQGTPSLTQSLSASALPAACVTECQCLLSCTSQVYFHSLGKPNAVNTKIHIIHDGLKYTLYMMACIRCCLLSVKIPNWLSPGTCTVLPINIHSVTNELLDAVWQENIANRSAHLEKCVVMERENCGQRWGIPVHC